MCCSMNQQPFTCHFKTWQNRRGLLMCFPAIFPPPPRKHGRGGTELTPRMVTVPAVGWNLTIECFSTNFDQKHQSLSVVKMISYGSQLDGPSRCWDKLLLCTGDECTVPAAPGECTNSSPSSLLILFSDSCLQHHIRSISL